MEELNQQEIKQEVNQPSTVSTNKIKIKKYLPFAILGLVCLGVGIGSGIGIGITISNKKTNDLIDQTYSWEQLKN
jgi:hypothetical protein